MRRNAYTDKAEMDKAQQAAQTCASEIPGTFNQVDAMTKEIYSLKDTITGLKAELLDLYRQVCNKGY